MQLIWLSYRYILLAIKVLIYICTNLHILSSVHINVTADHIVEKEIINCKGRNSCDEELHFHFAKL